MSSVCVRSKDIRRRKKRGRGGRGKESTNTASDPSNAATSKARATTPKRVPVDDVHATEFIVVDKLLSSETDEKFDTRSTKLGVISEAR